MAALRSIEAWWRTAGLSDPCGDVVINWLERGDPLPPPPRHPPATDPASRPKVVANQYYTATFPDRLDALQAALGRISGLPGCDAGRVAVAPRGQADADVMWIGDCPSVDDLRAREPLSGAEAQLLDAMARAMALDPHRHYRALLAACRPASGTIAPDMLAPLGALLRHHIALARPRRVVMFGSSPARAILDVPMSNLRGRLHIFNHGDVSVPLVVTHHPRTMLLRPHLKRQVWDDLRVLLRETGG